MASPQPANDAVSADHSAIDAVVDAFFAAFTSAPDCAARMDVLRELFLPGAVIVKACGSTPVVYDVEGFLAPRLALLRGSTLTGFREGRVRGRTEVFGDIAQHVCSYEKQWTQDGRGAAGRGMKIFHFVRLPSGWRISAVAWDDERDGLAVDPQWLG
jgi:hypothetical protein